MIRAPVLGAVAWGAKALFAIVSTAIIVRTLGPAEYGVWATVAAVRSLILLMDAGLSLPATRDVAQRGVVAGAGERFRAALRLYVVLAGIAAAAGVVSAPLPEILLRLAPEDAEIARAVTMLFGVEAALTLIGSPFAAALRGVDRMGVLALSNSVAAIAGALAAIPLTQSYGLLGASAATLGARAVMTGWHVLALRRAFEISTARGDALGAVVQSSVAMWAIVLASQIPVALDVPIVGGYFGAETAGWFALGAIVPSVAAGLLFSMMDALLGRHASAPPDRQGGMLLVVTQAACLLAGVGFTLAAVRAGDVLVVWTGTSDAISVDVLRVYAAAWAVNIPMHALVLALLSRHRHGLLVPLVVGEAAANLGLSLALAPVVGPAGPAWASLLAMSVSNLVVAPTIASTHAGVTGRSLRAAALRGYAEGVIIAAVVAAVSLVSPDSASRLATTTILALVLGGAAAARVARGDVRGTA